MTRFIQIYLYGVRVQLDRKIMDTFCSQDIIEPSSSLSKFTNFHSLLVKTPLTPRSFFMLMLS